MSELLDSGARREFKSGAVRDIADDKGRCDLLPLDVVARFVTMGTSDSYDIVLMAINNYVREGKVSELYRAVQRFCVENDIDLYTAMLEVAIHYADGARKYEERNWEKGLNVHCFIDSGVRHYLKFKRGDTDEPHHRAFIWNMFGAIWTHTYKPDLIDLPFKEYENSIEFDGKMLVESVREELSMKHRETCFA